jgi:putative hemolysin
MVGEHSTITEGEQKAVQDNLLDLDQIIKNKSPLLKNLLPDFVLGYLKRTIHQDELNSYLIKFGKQTGIDFIDLVLNEMNTKLDLRGLENIPAKGRCIIASNHPLGGLDGMALMLAISKVRRDIVFPVNDLLMNIKNLEELFIPINKHGSNAENVRIINNTFASDKLICYFPFGLVSRKRKGKIYDLEWKPTFITRAKRFERDIIPTHISGRNTNFFYNLANLRKKLGIKVNIEMLYLPDELLKQKNKTLKMTFAEPVPFSFFDKRYSNSEWAELMRKYIYTLETGNIDTFQKWFDKR